MWTESWMVQVEWSEGTIALLHWFRHLRIRWEIRANLHHAFVSSLD